MVDDVCPKFNMADVEEKTMTVKEVSEALNVDRSTITRHLKKIRCLWNVAQAENGKQTLITQEEAIELKNRIAISGRNDLKSVNTAKSITAEIDK